MTALALSWPDAAVIVSAIWATALVVFVTCIVRMSGRKGPR